MTESQRPTVKKMNSGFTLVEIAMVLMIVTLLLVGLVPTISSQMEQQRTNETRRQMSEIKEALIGYALINGRLPCSADPTKILGQSGWGTERACNASTSYGVVPWVTLGTSETDGWGNRFTYRVTLTFADTTDGTGASCATTAGISFQLCSVGDPDIYSASTWVTTVANDVPAIIISHGKNGAGAYTPQGTQRPSGSTDEQENTDHNLDWRYVSRIPTSDFDDLVEWVTPNILYNRMVAAGKLP